MSNRRKIQPDPRPATDLLAALDGARIPGGCDTCDAEQVVVAHAYGHNVHRLSIEHDRRCPTHRRMKQRGLAS